MFTALKISTLEVDEPLSTVSLATHHLAGDSGSRGLRLSRDMGVILVKSNVLTERCQLGSITITGANTCRACCTAVRWCPYSHGQPPKGMDMAQWLFNPQPTNVLSGHEEQLIPQPYPFPIPSDLNWSQWRTFARQRILYTCLPS
jgi:hypothetical protein